MSWVPRYTTEQKIARRIKEQQEIEARKLEAEAKEKQRLDDIRKNKADWQQENQDIVLFEILQKLNEIQEEQKHLKTKLEDIEECLGTTRKEEEHSSCNYSRCGRHSDDSDEDNNDDIRSLLQQILRKI